MTGVWIVEVRDSRRDNWEPRSTGSVVGHHTRERARVLASMCRNAWGAGNVRVVRYERRG